MGTVLSIVVACLALPAAMYLLQDRLIYFPEPATLEQLSGDGLRAWPSPRDFRGLVAEPADRVRGTAIVFHGNAGHAGHRAFYANALTPLGLRVILAEYPGYGPRPGSPGEASLEADAAATVMRAHREYGGPLLLIGESLGAAVAVAAGARHADIATGLLLITPWDRLVNVASHHYPWLPARWMLRDRYDNVRALQRFDGPVVVAVAGSDRIVPPRLGSALHAGFGGRKRLLILEGSDHNDWPRHVDAAWWRAATDFALGDAH